MNALISQEKSLSNRSNKKFIEMLIKQLKIANIATKQARKDICLFF